jgi:hypothetical protein
LTNESCWKRKGGEMESNNFDHREKKRNGIIEKRETKINKPGETKSM